MKKRCIALLLAAMTVLNTCYAATSGTSTAAALMNELNNPAITIERAEDILTQATAMKQRAEDRTNAVKVVAQAKNKKLELEKAAAEARRVAQEAERLRHEAALKIAEDERKRQQVLAAAAEAERLKAEEEAARIKAEAEQLKKGAAHGMLKDAFTRWKARASSRKKIKKLSEELKRISGDIKNMFSQKSYGELLAVLQSAVPEEAAAASSGSFSKSLGAGSSSSIDFTSLDADQQRQLAARLAFLECRAAHDVRMYEAVNPEELIRRQMPWVINAVRSAQMAEEKRQVADAQKMRRAKLKDHLSKKEENFRQQIALLQEEHAREKEQLLAEIKMLVCTPPDVKDKAEKDPEFSLMQREVDKLKIENAGLRARLETQEKMGASAASSLPSEPLFDPLLEAEWRALMDGMQQRDDEKLKASVAEQQRLRSVVEELRQKNDASMRQHKLAEERRLRMEEQAKRLSEEIAALSQLVRTLEHQNKTAEDQISLLQKEKEQSGRFANLLKQMQRSERDLKAERDAVGEKNEKLQHELASVRERLAECTNHLNEARGKARTAGALQARNTHLEDALEKSQADNRQRAATIEDLSSKLALAEAKVQGFFERCRAKDLESGKLQDQAVRQEALVAELNRRLALQKDHIAILQQQLNTFASIDEMAGRK